MPSDPRAFYNFDVGCRVFARAATGTVTFVCAEVHGDALGRSMFWTDDDLKIACQLCLTAQQPSTASGIIRDGCGMQALQPDDEEMHINELPYPVLAHILLHCDMITQLWLDRVCILWRLLLEDYAVARQRLRILDISCLMAETPVEEEFNIECHYQTYRLVLRLDHSLTVSTQTLALVDTVGCFDPTKEIDWQDAAGYAHYMKRHDFHDRLKLIRHTLKAQNQRVPLIIIKDGGDCPESVSPVLMDIRDEGEEAPRYECRAQRQWMEVCQQLLFVNYTAAIPTGLHHKSILDALFYYGAADRTWLEDGHRVERGMHEQGAHLQIHIPVLRFHCTESAAEQCRRFIVAVNDNCPPVSQQMMEKVTGVLARWVQTLAYPGQWTGIRRFLNLFSNIGLNDHPQSWDDVDLRQLNVAVLSRLAMHILDEFFQD
ncbi:uncharacterized protein LOC129600225 [Paramacrobiotus metropolitanus]|uniref:uncharacterized protein LOC129600225 n=1 Tax=Paramacrobiotus metropolitanus TaxID=2943436 RepID=UPI00244576DD|nr:uncharacterized protein LOC129600225 [Paramacrobiotus metropolitanus]